MISELFGVQGKIATDQGARCLTAIILKHELGSLQLLEIDQSILEFKIVGTLEAEGDGPGLRYCSALAVLNAANMFMARAIFEHPHSWDLVSGNAGLDWRTLVQSIANSGVARTLPYVDYIGRCIAALMPERTPSTEAIVRRIVHGARIKQLAPLDGAERRYDPGDVGPIPRGHTADGRFVLLDRTRDRETLATANQLLSPQFLAKLAPIHFWAAQFTWGKRLNATWAGEALMGACIREGRRRIPSSPR